MLLWKNLFGRQDRHIKIDPGYPEGELFVEVLDDYLVTLEFPQRERKTHIISIAIFKLKILKNKKKLY